MKARHIFAGLVVAALVAWTMVSCDLGAVSIKDRISSFQDDLNTSSRSNVYKNFHPDHAVYFALKDPNGTLFNTVYPPGSTYSLSIVDDSNSSAVIVLVNPGDHSIWAVPYYMSLDMDTTSKNDWRIVTLSDSQTNGGYTPRY